MNIFSKQILYLLRKLFDKQPSFNLYDFLFKTLELDIIYHVESPKQIEILGLPNKYENYVGYKQTINKQGKSVHQLQIVTFGK